MFLVLSCVSSKQLVTFSEIKPTAQESEIVAQKIDVLQKAFRPQHVLQTSLTKRLQGSKPDTFFVAKFSSSDPNQLFAGMVVFNMRFELHSIHPSRKFYTGDSLILYSGAIRDSILSRIEIVSGLLSFKISTPVEVFKCRDGYFAKCEVVNMDTSIYIMDGEYTCQFNNRLSLVGW